MALLTVSQEIHQLAFGIVFQLSFFGVSSQQGNNKVSQDIGISDSFSIGR